MSLATIRTLYAHHWWANRTLLDTAAELGDTAVAREIGKQFSEPTLKGLFFHIYGVDALWLSRWRGVSPTSAPMEAELAPSLAALGERWVAREREQAEYLGALDDADLARVIRYRLLSGKEYAQPLEPLLHHVTTTAPTTAASLPRCSRWSAARRRARDSRGSSRSAAARIGRERVAVSAQRGGAG